MKVFKNINVFKNFKLFKYSMAYKFTKVSVTNVFSLQASEFSGE